jgi:hypothetical protein
VVGGEALAMGEGDVGHRGEVRQPVKSPASGRSDSAQEAGIACVSSLASIACIALDHAVVERAQLVVADLGRRRGGGAGTARAAGSAGRAGSAVHRRARGAGVGSAGVGGAGLAAHIASQGAQGSQAAAAQGAQASRAQGLAAASCRRGT